MEFNGKSIFSITNSNWVCGKPIEISSESGMTDILTNATANDVGKIYKYTGETGTYENGALYVIEVSE